MCFDLKMASQVFINIGIVLLGTFVVCFAETLCTPEEIAAKKLATANNDLALKLLSQTRSNKGNVFFSPLSLSAAFGMLYYGTKGATAKELRNALGYETADLPEEQVHQTFHQFLTKSLVTSDQSAYVLSLANAVLLDEKLRVVPTYKKDIQELYQASVQDVDFRNQGPQIVSKINSWVKEKTSGKIDKLLDRMSSNAALVLLNAVYFKGTWKTEFEPRKTRPETFYQYGLQDKTSRVPMMKLTERLPFSMVKDAQVVELPYKGENISMIIIVPTDLNGLASLEKSLTLEKLTEIRNELDFTKVRLTLPKFKIEYSREMSQDFQNLGVKSVFSPGSDFSGLADDKNLFVTQVLHKAVVEVNEEGSEAAAVTGIVSNRMRPIFDTTPEIVANRPFLFAIVDRRSDMILFLGRVTNL